MPSGMHAGLAPAVAEHHSPSPHLSIHGGSVCVHVQVVPSLGGVKLLYRRAATAAGACAGAAHDFPALAHRLAQGFRGKAFVDQVW